MMTGLAVFGIWCWASFAIGGAMLARADYLNGTLSGRRALCYAIVGAMVPPFWGVIALCAGWDDWRSARELAWANEECEELR